MKSIVIIRTTDKLMREREPPMIAATRDMPDFVVAYLANICDKSRPLNCHRVTKIYPF
jgi:hypothetical protein